MLDMSALDDATLEAEAERGTKLAEHVLRLTVESREVGAATAQSLHDQTKQLEGVRDILEETGNNLDDVDTNVEKLTKSKVRRAAEAPARIFGVTGRKDKSSKGVRKDGLAVDDVRKRERIGKQIDHFFGREKQTSVQPVLAHGVPRDDYSDFSNAKVREQLKRQDQVLDETSVQLKELKDLAVDIQNEIEIEAEIVDGIDAPGVTHRIRANHRKLVRALRV